MREGRLYNERIWQWSNETTHENWNFTISLSLSLLSFSIRQVLHRPRTPTCRRLYSAWFRARTRGNFGTPVNQYRMPKSWENPSIFDAKFLAEEARNRRPDWEICPTFMSISSETSHSNTRYVPATDMCQEDWYRKLTREMHILCICLSQNFSYDNSIL